MPYTTFVAEVLMANTTITLDQFHNLLADAYAVSVNDTLYFVGYDTDDNPYIADNDGDDYVDLSTVDGDIELDDDYAVFFYVEEQPFRMIFLDIKKLV
jgi:hypothetical protein